MLRHRNIKADDTHNQGIFIGRRFELIIWGDVMIY